MDNNHLGDGREGWIPELTYQSEKASRPKQQEAGTVRQTMLFNRQDTATLILKEGPGVGT